MKRRRTLRQVVSGMVLAMLLLAGSVHAQLLFVSAYPPAAVTTYTPSGSASTYSSSFDDPQGLVFNSAGDLFVGDDGSGNIYKFTPAGTQSTYANIGSTADPDGAAFDHAGNLYVSDGNSGNVYKIAPGGGSMSTFASGLNGPDALAFDNASNLYVACEGNGLVVQVMPNGTTNIFASSELAEPAGLAFDGEGDLYISCAAGNNIIEIPTNGTPTTFFSGLFDPRGLAFDAAGNLYVAATEEYAILKISPQASASLFAFNSSGGEPVALAFQPIPSLQGVYAGGTFQLSVTMPSPYYTTIIQSSTNLVTWTSVYTNTPPFTFTDSVAGAMRAYRAVLDTNFY
jgi:sugar lactone lactonase YvrE